MKIKCIKDTIGFTKGKVYESVKIWPYFYVADSLGRLNERTLLLNSGFFEEEIKHFSGCSDYYFNWKITNDCKIKTPKFKVGDYVVTEIYKSANIEFINFIKISKIRKANWEYKYNWYKEESLRTPTKEELKLYFR